MNPPGPNWKALPTRPGANVTFDDDASFAMTTSRVSPSPGHQLTRSAGGTTHAGAATVICAAVDCIPPNDATTDVEPGATAVTSPTMLTLATAGLDDT